HHLGVRGLNQVLHDCLDLVELLFVHHHLRIAHRLLQAGRAHSARPGLTTPRLRVAVSAMQRTTKAKASAPALAGRREGPSPRGTTSLVSEPPCTVKCSTFEHLEQCHETVPAPDDS